MGHGREDDCGLRKAEEDRALHLCHWHARACLHGLFGVRRQVADRLSRPGRALTRGSVRDPSGGFDARGSRCRREDRPLLPLLGKRLAHEAGQHRQPERLQLPLGQRSPGEHRQGAEQRPGGHAHDPHGAGLGRARRALPTRYPQPRSRLSEEVRESRRAPLPVGRPHLGRLERAELQDLPEPAVQARQARLTRDVPQAPQRRGARRFMASTGANRVVAGETAPFSHWDSKGKPTAPGPLLFLRKLLCVDSSGHSTCKTNVHADIFATHPYTSGNAFHHAVQRERRLLRRPAAVETTDQRGLEGASTSRTEAVATVSASGSPSSAGTRSRSIRMLCPRISTPAGLPRRSTARGSSGSARFSGVSSATTRSARTSSLASTSPVSTTATPRRRSRILARRIRIRRTAVRTRLRSPRSGPSASRSSPTPRKGTSRSGAGRRTAPGARHDPEEGVGALEALEGLHGGQRRDLQEDLRVRHEDRQAPRDRSRGSVGRFLADPAEGSFRESLRLRRRDPLLASRRATAKSPAPRRVS